MKKLLLNEAFLKQLKALPPNQYRHVAGTILDLLVGRCPDHSTAIEGTPYRRLAIGDYRVVYQADEELSTWSPPGCATTMSCTVACGNSNDGSV